MKIQFVTPYTEFKKCIFDNTDESLELDNITDYADAEAIPEAFESYCNDNDKEETFNFVLVSSELQILEKLQGSKVDLETIEYLEQAEAIEDYNLIKFEYLYDCLGYDLIESFNFQDHLERLQEQYILDEKKEKTKRRLERRVLNLRTFSYAPELNIAYVKDFYGKVVELKCPQCTSIGDALDYILTDKKPFMIYPNQYKELACVHFTDYHN